MFKQAISTLTFLTTKNTSRLFSSSAAAHAGRLAGKTAIVTGGGSGIGRETALCFSREGANVLVADLSATSSAQTVDEIVKAGGKAEAFQVDVSDAKQVQEMMKAADKMGNFKIVFNNAGISHAEDGDAEGTGEEVWDVTQRVNVKGVFFGCKYAIPYLRNNGGGSIINTASFVAHLGAATPQIAYTTSKGAVLAMTRELAVIHAREKIRFNALCPGPLNTDLLQKYLDTEDKRQRRLVHIPMGRFGEAKEIAETVVFLASEESSFVTGSSLMVDGGITAAYVTPE